VVPPVAVAVTATDWPTPCALAGLAVTLVMVGRDAVGAAVTV
jgi:hypothetical protein